MTNLLLPAEHSVAELLTEKQREFINLYFSGIRPDTIDWLHREIYDVPDYSIEKRGVLFSWETDSPISVFELSENENFKDARRLETAEKSVVIENLKIASTYYWRVNDSKTASFSTEDIAPRIIRAEGVYNIRDIGGWKTEDGRRIKQGLIYRGSYMNEITEEGITVLRDTLGIRTDIDLRKEMIGEMDASPLGDTVKFYLFPFEHPYNEFFTEEQIEATCQVFELFADENNYPIFFHCYHGADRTGNIAYILNCLLGMKYEDILLEFEMTSLGACGVRYGFGEGFEGFEKQLADYDENGDIRKGAEKFLLAHGVSQQTLEKIRRNLLG
ncbi:MAG: tyrosine-protein phosphatase [Clostridia bacterium]|nr:tyrosine-protein phosphatase [Clostridia bacterium]